MEKKNSVEYELFNKFSIDALESFETILKYSDRSNELYSVIGDVLRKKYEEGKYELEEAIPYEKGKAIISSFTAAPKVIEF